MEDKPYLLRLYLDCNHKCLICMTADFIKNAKPINLADIKKEILEAKKNGYNYIDLGGAEPTLYPKLPHIIQYINELGLFSTMCTNGHLFSSVDFTKKIASLNVRGIKISFHSHKKEIFDFITRVPGSYDSILKAIENIRKYLDIYPNESYSRPLNINSYVEVFHKYSLNYLLMNIVINRLNYKDLPDIVDFLYERNIRVIKITQLCLSGKVYEHPELLVGLDKVEPYLRKAVALAKKLKMLYFLGTLPICILESEAEHFIPLVDTATYVKFIFCESCRHNKRCPGVGKASLVAKYGKQLLSAKDLFPDKFFESYFKEKDIAFIKKI